MREELFADVVTLVAAVWLGTLSTIAAFLVVGPCSDLGGADPRFLCVGGLGGSVWVPFVFLTLLSAGGLVAIRPFVASAFDAD